MAAALAAGLLATPIHAATEFPAFVPGRIVVRFKPGSPTLRALAASPAGARARAGEPEALIPHGLPSGRGPGIEGSLARTARVRLLPGEDVLDAVSAWSRREDVEYVAPVHLIPLLASAGQGASSNAALLPDDPELDAQWQHGAIGSTEAWEMAAGGPGTLIAIVDTGVDLDHPDLRDNLHVNAIEAAGATGVDDDENGYVDDVSGYDFTDVPEVDGAGDFVERDPEPADDVGHGTWVTGMATATARNANGGAGVAYEARFLPLRAGFRARTGFSLGFLAEDDAAAAVAYAADNGAEVINLSFGDVVRAPILEDAVRYAVDKGVIVVAAAGNSGNGIPFFPAALEGVLAVGSFDRSGRRSTFSTWGPHVRLLAPGSSVYTTELGTGYGSKSGTSLAAPVVAGAAALVRSLHPEWTAAQVVSALQGAALTPPGNADAHGARLLSAAYGVRSDAGATVELRGLATGDAFHDVIEIHGTVQGPLVRGYRVLARRGTEESWRTLAAEVRGQAVDELLALWDVSAEPEGDAFIRVEALGLDEAVAAHELAVRIDHTPPVLSGFEIIPVLSGPHTGVRVLAESNDEAAGVLVARDGPSEFRFESVATGHQVVLGLDGPLGSPGTDLTIETRITNLAGLTAVRSDVVRLPAAPATTDVRRGRAPSVRTWLPVILDLNGDGQPEMVAEAHPSGSTYGEVIAFNWQGRDQCPGCAEGPFTRVWESGNNFIPQDVADFDGDGRPELLGLALQEVRVYSSTEPGGFPDELRWSLNGAWPARFIPALTAPAFDIVATRDTEIRIYRREGAALAARQTIPNPTTGINSISPDIVEVAGGPGSGLRLATIDGDRDLILLERGSGGLFEPFWTTRLVGAGEFQPALAAADLDGDGVDEIVVVEAVGVLPSPASGLRDGFYRLHVLRGSDEGYEESASMSVGVAGHFPGTMVSLIRSSLRESAGRDEIWFSTGERLYLVGWNDGAPALRGTWEGIPPVHPASGDLAANGLPAHPAAIFAAENGEPGAQFESPTDSASVPVSLTPRVSAFQDHGGLVNVTITWNDAGGPWIVLERDLARPDDVLISVPDEPRLSLDLEAGTQHLFQVSSQTAGGPMDSIIVRALIGNPIRSVAASGSDIEITWERPLRVTERSHAVVDNGDVGVSSAVLDRSGTRLHLRTRSPLTAGVSHSVQLAGYETDPAHAVGPPDSVATFEVAGTSADLVVRSVQAIDPTQIKVLLEPDAPEELAPGDVQVEPGIEVLEVIRSPGYLSVVLSPETPLHSGSYHFTLAPGLAGPGGSATVREGRGNSIAFSVSPRVFPNPVRSSGVARFEWLTSGALVRVFDLAGREVWSAAAPAEGTVVWETDRAAPGVYLYRIEGPYPAEGKLAVVR